MISNAKRAKNMQQDVNILKNELASTLARHNPTERAQDRLSRVISNRGNTPVTLQNLNALVQIFFF